MYLCWYLDVTKLSCERETAGEGTENNITITFSYEFGLINDITRSIIT